MRNRAPRPRIGVTGPGFRGDAGRLAASAAIWVSGGRPVWLAPDRGPSRLSLNGIVVTGGSDIHPRLYGSPEAPWSPPDVIRDEFELAVLSYAERRRLPVLGICRGAQLMNVHAGGNLHSDISRMRRNTPNRPSILPVKWAEIADDCRLRGIVGTARLRINSLHHQAIRDTGRNLVRTARDRDGITQAVEVPGEPFFVGVQWHPEYLAWKRAHLDLFRALVHAARAGLPDGAPRGA